MFHILVAYSDCLFFIAVGGLMVFGPKKWFHANESPEKLAQRQRLIRISGGILLIVGIIQLLIRLFS
jgi:hypothetical protein